MQNVVICGVGRVGLVTAACLSALGNRVACYDTDRQRLQTLQGGRTPFYEPKLGQLLVENRERGLLRYCADISDALFGCEIVFIAVPTPIGAAGEADLTCVRAAVREIARSASSPLVVVNKSTVPVETADLVGRLLNVRSGGGWSVASNPEFLREGSAVDDFLHPDRVVIGTADVRARVALETLYAPLNAPIICVDVRTAEMIKYAANSFLATKISFVNELANICEAVDADIDGVLAGIAADSRIGGAFLQPGLGFGGSCLPKDLSALAYSGRAHGIEPTLLESVLHVNRQRICRAVFAIEAEIGDVDGQAIALLGAAFKGGTDDVRESPAIALARVLLGKGALLRVSDPIAWQNVAAQLPGIACGPNAQEACTGAAAVIVATDWPEYANLDWGPIAARMHGRCVLDLRNVADGAAVAAAGLEYRGVGRRLAARMRVA